MNGVTWDERGDGDWLASNGRWYPAHQRPRGWVTLALPPAPGHRGAEGVNDWLTEKAAAAVSAGRAIAPTIAPTPVSADGAAGKAMPSFSDLLNVGDVSFSELLNVGDSEPDTEPERSSSSTPPPRPSAPPPNSRTTRDSQTGRRVADATATNVKTYKKRIAPGERPSGALPSAPELPPEQAWRDTPAPPGRVDSAPPPPVVQKTAPRIVATPPSSAALAGDLGRVIGKARKKLEEAINEASKG